MREISITANDAGRRLDRFLRKYLRNASLSEIYRLIRKDVRIGGKRPGESYVLKEGDVICLYLSDEVISRMTGAGSSPADDSSGRHGTAAGGRKRAKRQFRIIFEDDIILIVSKPYGLLTHGDRREKKDHLTNQVRDYLIERGMFDPSEEKVFSPAPANRLDRNTTGLVIFGKNSAALKELNEMIREDKISKYYLTVVHGVIDHDMTLTGALTKDEARNRVTISSADTADGGRSRTAGITTIVHPLEELSFGRGNKATLVEIELVTGRSHQIRAHLASIGHPVIGDSKYTSAAYRQADRTAAQNFGLSTQLLHACRLRVDDAGECLGYLRGREFTAPLPQAFDRILRSMEHIRRFDQ